MVWHSGACDQAAGLTALLASVQPNGSGYGGTMILNARSNNPRYKVVYVVNA